jgi:hypothetical protein
MDIKQRIQELSLDDKAKLYFMGLVRKGEIDTLPENPKAAYIKMVMGKTEDYKPSHRAYNVIDKSNNDKIVAKELSRDKALELAKTNKDYMIDATDRLAETRPDWTPPPMGMGGEEKEDEEQDEYDKGWYGESLRETATQLGYLKENHANQKYYKLLNVLNDKGHLHRYGVIQLQTEFGLKEKEAQEIYNQYKKDLMKEVDGMEGGIDPNAMQYEKVTFVYTEQGGRFYGLDVYVSKDQPQRSDKLRYDEANEWLKDTLHYIHEDDLIPRKYISGLEDLDLIVERLKELDIEASHNDFMDVS